MLYGICDEEMLHLNNITIWMVTFQDMVQRLRSLNQLVQHNIHTMGKYFSVAFIEWSHLMITSQNQKLEPPCTA